MWHRNSIPWPQCSYRERGRDRDRQTDRHTDTQTIFRWFKNVRCWFLHWICWMSTIHLLPVYLTYCSRVSRISPHDENFHQVWSWYDRPLPIGCSVLAADTLRDVVTLTFDLLTLVSGHTWRVTRWTSSLSAKLLRLSVLKLWVLTLVH